MAALFLLAGCITQPVNQPITDAQSEAAKPCGKYPKHYSFDSWLDAQQNPVPDPAIIMSFSGGFLHAAALSDAVLTALTDFDVNDCTNEPPCWRPLLSHIIVISSTSGGSFANANFLVNGPSGISKGFRPFLHSNLAWELIKEGLERPWTWPTIVGPFANRSRYMIYLLERDLLKKGKKPVTFGDIGTDRHFAVFGTTDYDAERRLLFTQEQFDLLCSDLGRLPVAAAMAASGAFPLFFTDVELRNFWADDDTKCPLDKTKLIPPPQDPYFDLQAYLDRRYADSLVNSAANVDPPPFRRVKYLHLFDGGIADNLAIRALFRLFNGDRLKSAPFQHKSILYVEVNARSDPVPAKDKSSGSPGIPGLVVGVPYAAIDNVTALSNLDGYYFWGGMFSSTKKTDPFAEAMYLTSVDYDLEKDPKTQQDLKNVSGISLSGPDIELLYQGGRRLLFQDPCFAKFLSEFKDKIRYNGPASEKPIDTQRCVNFLYPEMPMVRKIPAFPHG
jgi:NTE family protein